MYIVTVVPRDAHTDPYEVVCTDRKSVCALARLINDSETMFRIHTTNPDEFTTKCTMHTVLNHANLTWWIPNDRACSSYELVHEMADKYSKKLIALLEQHTRIRCSLMSCGELSQVEYTLHADGRIFAFTYANILPESTPVVFEREFHNTDALFKFVRELVLPYSFNHTDIVMHVPGVS